MTKDDLVDEFYKEEMIGGGYHKNVMRRVSYYERGYDDCLKQVENLIEVLKSARDSLPDKSLIRSNIDKVLNSFSIPD